MPQHQIGAYRIVKPIGEGGMGAVYEAVQEPIGRRVALKVLLPQHAKSADVLQRFFNEARAVNLIEHPNIVIVSDYGQAPDGTAYLVMEFLRGETLAARLERVPRMPMVTALQVAAQIADALAAAHDKSIVHRDLKPGNVMLVRDPVAPGGERAKILDFGIAKLAQGQTPKTATTAVIGTPQYMSPEQCQGAGAVDDKTDVYALGAILYEMLAGRPLFIADTAIAYMGQHAFSEPPPLSSFAPELPSSVTALVHSLLVKQAQARPKMHQVGAELLRLLSETSGAGEAAMALHPAANASTTPSRSAGATSTMGGYTGETRGQISKRGRVLLLAATAGLLVSSAAVLLRGHVEQGLRTTGSGVSAASAVSASAPPSVLTPERSIPPQQPAAVALDSANKEPTKPVSAAKPVAPAKPQGAGSKAAVVNRPATSSASSASKNGSGRQPPTKPGIPAPRGKSAADYED